MSEAGQGRGTYNACVKLAQNVYFSGILSTKRDLICLLSVRNILQLHQEKYSLFYETQKPSQSVLHLSLLKEV